jgi:hypothetical protein
MFIRLPLLRPILQERRSGVAPDSSQRFKPPIQASDSSLKRDQQLLTRYPVGHKLSNTRG